MNHPARLAVAALACLLAAGEALANCASGQIFQITQCASGSWFAAPPSGSGPVTPFWWQLGYGNRLRTATNPGASASNGTGFQAPISTNGFIGNDSGALDTLQEMDLVSAVLVGGPPGSLCFGTDANWVNTGSDGCCDNSKAGSGTTSGPQGGSFDDNLLNPYWGPSLGPGNFYLEYQLDAPMGVLLTEGTGIYFAAAFFASRARNRDPNDIDEGRFDLSAINDGDPNPAFPGRNNIIPWQNVPQLRLVSISPSPQDPNVAASARVAWDPVRVVSDNSTRPSGTPAAVLNAPGVGVRDQGPLVRFVIERAPVINQQGACGTFAPIQELAGSRTSTTVSSLCARTCLRLRTRLGRKPVSTEVSLGSASRAELGDLGLEFVSQHLVVAIQPVADQDADGDGFFRCINDCNDSLNAIHPGAAELCDDLDNDCDGTVDDFPTDTSMCGVGECFRSSRCIAGVDSCAPGEPETEHCDNLDNDCNGMADDFVTPVTCGLGECISTSQCIAGVSTCMPGAPAPEICDNLDNNCDGTVDGFATGCGVGACGQTGSCSSGNDSCVPGTPGVEVCDSADNDCNGLTDDRDADGDTYLVCQDCDESNPTINPGAAEICDGLDNDCNGVTDEDAQGSDSDGDSVRNACDNCILAVNPSQADNDLDRRGNACDNCIFIYNPGQSDQDVDQRGDVCDNCPTEANTLQDDSDSDQVGDVCDNCALERNTDQTDSDSDLEGDACDLNDGLVQLSVLAPTAVQYQEDAQFVAINLYRGSMEILKTSHIYSQDPAAVSSAAQFCFLGGGQLNDPFVPSPGEIVYYLATGLDGGGAETTLGTDSSGATRPHHNPCP